MKNVLAGIVVGTVLLMANELFIMDKETKALIDWIKTNSEQIKLNNVTIVAWGEAIAKLEKRVDELEIQLAELSEKGDKHEH